MGQLMPMNEETLQEISQPKRAEDALVAAAQNGDAAAFETLVLRHKRLVLAITRRMTGSFDEAEDLTQQALMKAFANLSRFGGRCSFSTWLVTIAMNEARMWHRKAHRSREVSIAEMGSPENYDLPLEFEDGRPSPEATYSEKERNRLLFSAMEDLKPGMREAVRLCDLEEISTVAAAALLGVSANGVKSRRLRARIELRRRMESRLAHGKNRSGKGAHRRTRGTANQPKLARACGAPTSPELEYPAA